MLVFLLEDPARKPRLRFETQDPRLKRLVGFLVLFFLLFPSFPPCTSSTMERARKRLRLFFFCNVLSLKTNLIRIRSSMSQRIARHQAPAKLSSNSLLSVTVFSSKFSSVFSSSSCTFVNISLKWFKLSVSKDLVMACNAE